MPNVCSECQSINPADATKCKRCKFPFDGQWPSLVSKMVGNYRLVRRIGGGGFGAVYEARHAVLGNAFAVKILHPRLAQDPSFIERFQKEAHVLAELRHEHVLQVIDFGYVEELGFYLITEWLEGRSLFRIWRTQPQLEWGWIWSLFAQLLDALAYAHDRGIVHRDLKPENLMLITGSRGRMILKIVDFGIATIIEQHAEAKSQRSKYAVGTPHYMAPEQVRGDVDLIGPQTDLYACGVILAELFTGHRAFDAGENRETMRLHLEVLPPHLSELNPTQDYPEVLEALIQRALCKDLSGRFANAAEFDQALEQAMKACDITPITEDIYQDLKKDPAVRQARQQRPSISYQRISQSERDSRVWFWSIGLVVTAALTVSIWFWASLAGIFFPTTPPVDEIPPLRKSPVVAHGWQQFDTNSHADAGDDLALYERESVPDQLSAPETPDAVSSEDLIRDAKPQPIIPTKKQPVVRRPVTKQKLIRPPKRPTTPQPKQIEPSPPPRPEPKPDVRPITPLIQLQLLSKPEKAEVWINGQKRGLTPLTIQIEQGTALKITFKKKGYTPQTIHQQPQKAAKYSVEMIEDLFTP